MRSFEGGGLERALLFGIFGKPFWYATDECQSEASGRAEAALTAAGDAVVVEGLDGLRLAAPEPATDEMTGEAETAGLEAAAPQAVAEEALTHLLNLIIQSLHSTP